MQEHDTGCTEDSGRNLPGQPLPIPFISDSKHQPSLAAGTISASEDAAAAKVAPEPRRSYTAGPALAGL